MRMQKVVGMLKIFHFALLSDLILLALIQAQDQSGFISIDCGANANTSYTETVTGINYISDASFINTGVIKSVTTQLKDGYQKQMWNLRSFPDGIRNCYKINITRGSKYLIRVIFLYGNYDGLNTLPQFDLHLGANRWDTVNIYDASIDQINEVIHIPSQNYIQICLVNTGTGTPFITAILFRPLKNDTYVTEFGSLIKRFRWDLGSITNKTYRYKYDPCDRVWNPHHDYDWTQISASIPANSFAQNDYQLPEIVMSTAATPVNASAPLVITWEPDNQTEQYYVYMHFAELQVLRKNQTREFNIFLNGDSWYQNFEPFYMSAFTIYSESGASGKEITFSLEMTKHSTLPPIMNAFEVYTLKEFPQSDTSQGDVDAISTIKSVYGVTRNWQGDPCSPVAYSWDGINCTYDGYNSPVITALNLSSSGLQGQIDPSISKLTMLEKLDLSNNSLDGQVPEFLSQLQNLKILNLENNNLNGSVPYELVKRSQDGSLSLSVGQNPKLCQSDQCNEKKKKRFITPVVASIIGVLLLVVAIATMFWTYRKRKPKASIVRTAPSEVSMSYTKQKETSLQLKKQVFSYFDVTEITNNFNTIIGKGGFGTVFMGYIYDTPVAVKMLSPSSVQGYQQFQAEVKLLMRVHHRNLTSLIGYCNEGTNKGLIYEHMANGNLKEHLSGQGRKTKFLSWEERLRIASDAASGLEYLHNGCKPPIIHRDVKSSNILLTENFQAKISDFGLSKIIPTEGGTHVSTIVAGTPGYLDPDYYQSNRLTEKSDVYSFGVVLLELITSKPVIGRNREESHISQWVRSMVETGDVKSIADSRLGGDYDTNSVWKAVETAMACVSPNPNRRPAMSETVIELKECLATELARTKYGGANSGDSVVLVSMNMHAEITPLAR